MTKERLTAFFDGVMAIIITVLVLALPQPASPSWEGLWAIRMNFLSYLITFIFVGVTWIAEHSTFDQVRKIDNRVIGMTFVQLFLLSLLPYLTDFVGNYYQAFVPQFLYGLLLTIIHVSYSLSRHFLHLSDKENTALATRTYFNRKVVFDWGLHLLALGLGIVYPPLVSIICLLTMFFWLIPSRWVDPLFYGRK